MLSANNRLHVCDVIFMTFSSDAQILQNCY